MRGRCGHAARPARTLPARPPRPTLLPASATPPSSVTSSAGRLLPGATCPPSRRPKPPRRLTINGLTKPHSDGPAQAQAALAPSGAPPDLACHPGQASHAHDDKRDVFTNTIKSLNGSDSPEAPGPHWKSRCSPATPARPRLCCRPHPPVPARPRPRAPGSGLLSPALAKRPPSAAFRSPLLRPDPLGWLRMKVSQANPTEPLPALIFLYHCPLFLSCNDFICLFTG